MGHRSAADRLRYLPSPSSSRSVSTEDGSGGPPSVSAHPVGSGAVGGGAVGGGAVGGGAVGGGAACCGAACCGGGGEWKLSGCGRGRGSVVCRWLGSDSGDAGFMPGPAGCASCTDCFALAATAAAAATASVSAASAAIAASAPASAAAAKARRSAVLARASRPRCALCSRTAEVTSPGESSAGGSSCRTRMAVEAQTRGGTRRPSRACQGLIRAHQGSSGLIMAHRRPVKGPRRGSKGGCERWVRSRLGPSMR